MAVCFRGAAELCGSLPYARCVAYYVVKAKKGKGKYPIRSSYGCKGM